MIRAMRRGGEPFDWSYPLLALIWVTLIAAINPRGEFPLDDDWAYIAMLRTLVVDHRVLPVDWAGMPLVGQIIWAAPFALLVPSVFVAARLATLVLGLM